MFRTKHIIFSVPIEKEVTVIDKKGNEIIKTISYRLQFIDSVRLMESLVSNLVNNLIETIHKTKRKYGHDDKKKNVKLAELNTKIVSAFLNKQKLKTI